MTQSLEQGYPGNQRSRVMKLEYQHSDHTSHWPAPMRPLHHLQQCLIRPLAHSFMPWKENFNAFTGLPFFKILETKSLWFYISKFSLKKWRYVYFIIILHSGTNVHAQSCLTPSDLMGHSPSGFTIRGISQARSTRVGCHFLLTDPSPQLRDWTASPVSPAVAGRFITTKSPGKSTGTSTTVANFHLLIF